MRVPSGARSVRSVLLAEGQNPLERILKSARADLRKSTVEDAISLLIRKDNTPVMRSAGDLSDLIPLEERSCEQPYVHVIGFEPDDEVFVKSICSRPWCLPCESIRVWRLKRKIMKYLEYHNPRNLWIVTRSTKNRPEFVASINLLRSAQVAFSKQATKKETHPFNKAQCWIATTEVTHDLLTGYNVHEHMIWGTESSRLDFEKLHLWWDRACGFRGAHLNVVQVNDSNHGINYIAKYLSDGIWGGLSVGRAYQIRNALKGRNRVNSKRGTVPKKIPSGYNLCCFAITDHECVGDGNFRPE